MRHLKIYRVIIVNIVLAAIIFRYGLLLYLQNLQESDFRSFLAASYIAVEVSHKLYDLKTQKLYQQMLFADLTTDNQLFIPFVNPAIFLVPFLPLVWFHKVGISTSLIYTSVIATNMVIFSLSVVLLLRQFVITSQPLFFILISFAFAPVFITLVHAQSSIVTFLVIILTYYFLQKRKYGIGGLIASTLFYKPQLYIVLAIFFLLTRKRNLLVGFVIGTLICIGISLVITKGDVLSYLHTLHWYTTVYESVPSNNEAMVSWLGFFSQIARFLPGLPVQAVAFFTSVITIVVSAIYIHPRLKRTGFSPLVFSILITTTLLAAMHVHLHDTLILLVPFYYFAHKSPSRGFYAFVTIGWFVFLLAYFSPTYPESILFIPTLYLLCMHIVLLRCLNHHHIP